MGTPTLIIVIGTCSIMIFFLGYWLGWMERGRK